jgi:hypothetical protein
VVGQDRDDLDTIWVFEAWRDEAAHRASLDMPPVRGVIERGLPLIAERDGAKLEPVGGIGLDQGPELVVFAVAHHGGLCHLAGE